MNPFDLLSRDHELLLSLANELTGGKGDPSGSAHERHRVAEHLVMEGSAHETIEEQFFWPVVRDRLHDGGMLARAGLEQEMTARSLLHELNRMRPSNSHFSTLVFSVASHVRSHLTYEETQLWPKLERALDRRELAELAEQMAGARRVAPTRPHPHTPPDARLLRRIGPITGTVDRAVDTLTARGR